MSNNYEGRFVRTSAPAQLTEVKKPKKIPFRRRITRFRRAVKKNRYCQIALSILICLLCFGCGRIHQFMVDKNDYNIRLEAEIAEVSAEVSGVYEATILQMSEAHREEIQALRAEYENLTPEELIKLEGEYLAKMLYPYRDNSERDLRTATWCALNRTDNPSYPDSIKEVCQQPSQWMGYSDDNPILNDLYEIAIKELETWHSGYRPVGIEYVYMNWSAKQITLRDTYEKTANTRYWQAG
jgi:hypothetical protein